MMKIQNNFVILMLQGFFGKIDSNFVRKYAPGI